MRERLVNIGKRLWGAALLAECQAGLFGCANGLVGWLLRYSPSVWQQVGKAVQLNVIIGGSMILLTFPSLLYSREAVGKSFPKTASPTHLSFPVAGPG